MDSAGLLFNAAAKKLELRKAAMMSDADADAKEDLANAEANTDAKAEAVEDIIKHQLSLTTKAGDSILKYLDELVSNKTLSLRK